MAMKFIILFLRIFHTLINQQVNAWHNNKPEILLIPHCPLPSFPYCFAAFLDDLCNYKLTVLNKIQQIK